MFETDDLQALGTLLKAGGWTTLTAVCLMLFSSATIRVAPHSHHLQGNRVAVPDNLGGGHPNCHRFCACALVSGGWHLLS